MKKTREELDFEIEEVREKQDHIGRMFFWGFTLVGLIIATLLVNNLSVEFQTKYMTINIIAAILALPILGLFTYAKKKKKVLSVQRKELISNLQADLAKTAKKKK